MDKATFLALLRAMQLRLNYLESMALFYHNVTPSELIQRSCSIMQNLLVGLQTRALQDPSAMGHDLPLGFRQRYMGLVNSVIEHVTRCMEFLMIEDGRVGEIRVTQEHLDAEESCMLCLEKFEEDMLMLHFGCDHKFHRSCIVGRHGIVSCCPICLQDI